jgi:hypothetical protein
MKKIGFIFSVLLDDLFVNCVLKCKHCMYVFNLNSGKVQENKIKSTRVCVWIDSAGHCLKIKPI